MSRVRFYNSKAWHNLRDNYSKSQDYICERCGRACYTKNDPRYIRLREQGYDVRFGIVHHIEHLTDATIQDTRVSMEWDNLEYLCIACHNKEHFEGDSKVEKKQPKEVREDVKFDERGRVIFDG